MADQDLHLPSRHSFVLHGLRMTFGNANRGQDGKPKKMTFGSSDRSRISPQCRNAAIRRGFKELLPHWMGFRSARIVQYIKDNGKNYFPDVAELNHVADSIGVVLRGSDKADSNDPSKTQTVHFSDEEICETLRQLATKKENDPEEFKTFLDPMATMEQLFCKALDHADDLEEQDREIFQNNSRFFLDYNWVKKTGLAVDGLPKSVPDWNEGHVQTIVTHICKLREQDQEAYLKLLKAKVKKKGDSSGKKKLREIMTEIKFEKRHPLEVNLWGRMAADASNPFQSVSCCFQNNSVSVHEYHGTTDYWTTMEDLLLEGEQGAAHVNQRRELHMSLMYEYYAFDITDFCSHLRPDQDPAKLLAEFFDAIVHVIWNLRLIGGRKQGNNTYFPEILLAELRCDNIAASYLPAYIDPVPVDNEMTVRSITRLLKYAQANQKGYNIPLTLVATSKPDEVKTLLNGTPFTLVEWTQMGAEINKAYAALVKGGNNNG